MVVATGTGRIQYCTFPENRSGVRVAAYRFSYSPCVGQQWKKCCLVPAYPVEVQSEGTAFVGSEV